MTKIKMLYGDDMKLPTGNEPFPKIWSDSIMSNEHKHNIKWASSWQNLSSGFPTKWNSNQPTQLQRLARKMKFRLWQA